MVDRTEPTIVTRGAGRGTTAVAWIALIAALLALTLAWMAYNRTGDDLENRIQQGVQDAMVGAERGVNEGVNTLDEGPDGVDEDDTDTTAPGAGTTDTNETQMNP